MLYNQAWEAKTKFTRPDFIAWLESKNPNEAYDFMCRNGSCLIGQYMAHHGVEWGNIKGTYWDICSDLFGGKNPGNHPVISELPQTFGAALERARAL